jgi:hypothetical protein
MCGSRLPAVRIETAIRKVDSGATRWVASDVIRDVTREKVQAKLR